MFSTSEVALSNAHQFADILLINLPSRPDKLDALSVTTSLADLSFTVIQGTTPHEISAASLPPNYDIEHISGSTAAWRSHLDALRHVINNRYETALILEDDMDWDVSLREQMSDVARGARFLAMSDEEAEMFTESGADTPSIAGDERTPYGTDWDVLWLGHCSAPWETASVHPNKSRTFTLLNDATVPASKRRYPPPMESQLAPGIPPLHHQGVTVDRNHAPHTRTMYTAEKVYCTWAYAVTFRGAQKILHDMSMQRYNLPYDLGLGSMCQGAIECLTVWPPIFGAMRRQGPTNSDIGLWQDANMIEQKPEAPEAATPPSPFIDREYTDTVNVLTPMRQNARALISRDRGSVKKQWDDEDDMKGSSEGWQVQRLYVL